MLAVVMTGDLRPVALNVPDTVAIDGACQYYGRRSELEAGRRAVSFAGFLSKTCDEARMSLYAGARAESEAAKLLLTRIALLHQTVFEMNAARMAAVADMTGDARMQALSRVTPSGEFLIAHRMGVMRAFDAWLDSGADFSLASYR
jgi:hypothetical protein